MQVLIEDQLKQVSGGDSWAGTPEGRAPADSSWGSFQAAASQFVSDAAKGVTTALGDCANGAAVGGILGSPAGPQGAALGAAAGCVLGAGFGVIRDAPSGMGGSTRDRPGLLKMINFS